MNDEILFRGKSLLTGEWIESGSLRQWDDGKVGLVHPARRTEKVDPDTLGRFTGIYDSLGTRIYEDDIVEYMGCGWEEPVFVRVVVKWSDGSWITQEPDCRFPDVLTSSGAKSMTVIGNIHDNPSLLSGGPYLPYRLQR